MSRRVVFIGGGGILTGTVLCNFCRLPENAVKDLEVILFDTKEENNRFNLRLLNRVFGLTGRSFKVQEVSSLDTVISCADLIAFGASASNDYGIDCAWANIENCRTIFESVTVNKNCWILNYANPADMLTTMLSCILPKNKVVGICTGSEEFRQNIGRLLSVDASKIKIDYCGSNHHGFVINITADGKDLMTSILKQTTKLNPREFSGLRRGDEYDLLANLDLLNSSGILTIPLGHDPYLHGSRSYHKEAKAARWRPERVDFLEIIENENMEVHKIWALLDSWGGSVIASTIIDILKGDNTRLDLMAPNGDLIPELNSDVYVEGPVHLENRTMKRIMFDIPEDIRLHIAHRAIYLDLLVKSWFNKDERGVIRALMLKGQTRNFKYSLTQIRQMLPEIMRIFLKKQSMESPLESVFEPIEKEYILARLRESRELDFLFI